MKATPMLLVDDGTYRIVERGVLAHSGSACPAITCPNEDLR
jgi:hypothetical protein